MTDAFQKALTFTLKYEGGYSDHPADKGGPTNQGITQDTYDLYRNTARLYRRGVKHLTSVERDTIYKTRYWGACNCSSLPEKNAIALFDFAVNSGVARAQRYYQNSQGDLAKFLNDRESFFKQIGVGSQSVFLKGWLNRMAALREYLK